MQKIKKSSVCKICFWCVFFISVLLSVLFILQSDGRVPPPPMDQGFANVDLSVYKTNGHWQFQYPRLQWAGGISASLTVGVYKLVVATTPENLNWHVRVLGMLMYLSSASLLIWVFVKNDFQRLIGIVLICTAGFQFLQPTAEIISAAYLCIFLAGIKKGWPDWILAFSLILFGLCKVELAMASAIVGIYWIWHGEGRQRKLHRLILMFLFSAALISPSLVLYGPSGVAGGRGFEAFSQHYAALVSRHQMSAVSGDGWSMSKEYMKNIFPGANTVMDVIQKNPRKYIDFLALSVTESIFSIIYVLKGLLLIFIFWILGGVAKHSVSVEKSNAWIYFLMILIFSLSPAILLAFVHVRYLARYFPEFVVLGMVAGGDILCQQGRSVTKRILIAMLILATVVWQMTNLSSILENSHGY